MRTIKIDGTIEAELEKRSSTKYGETVNGIANTALNRYFALIAEQSRLIQRSFAENELMAVLDCCNGTMFEPISVSLSGIAANVEDAVELDGLADKWKLDNSGDDLVQKLSGANPLTHLALIDFIEFFWRNPNTYVSALEAFKALHEKSRS